MNYQELSEIQAGTRPSALLRELGAYANQQGWSTMLGLTTVTIQTGIFRLVHADWATDQGPMQRHVLGLYLTFSILDANTPGAIWSQADEEFRATHPPETIARYEDRDHLAAARVTEVTEGKRAIDAWTNALDNIDQLPWFYRETRPATREAGWPYRIIGPDGHYYFNPPEQAVKRYLSFIDKQPQTYDETTNATGFGIASSKDTQNTLPTKSTPARLLNGPEVQLMMNLSSNYCNRNHFHLFLDKSLVTYAPKGRTTWEAVLDVENATRGTWDDSTETQQKLKDIIWAEVDKLGKTTRDDSLIAAYVLFKLATCQDGIARVGFTELLHLEGKTKLGAADREQRAKEYDAVFRQWTAWKPVGRRQWRDPKTGKTRNIEEPSPLFIYQGPYYPNGQGPLTGMYKGPLGFTFLDSAMTKEYRADPGLCHFFGTLQDLAQIPPGKVPGDWARSIGLTAAQAIRNNAKNTGATMNLTRRHLLTTHTPNTPVQRILDGDDPGRARKYWAEALNILKERGQLAGVEEAPTHFPRKSWADAWLDETVTVTLGASWADAPTRVLERTQERKALKAERSKGKKKG